ncbi:MAG: phosphoenolpyruvate--protein phosphotransferase [Alphaproteobacteria bacterium]|nr:phosphoenolpyruvate--protein phosphotransferase [Alphaproteobacteria bacterium]
MQEKRLEKTILITNRLGLHARASAKFVELISKCKSKFVIRKGKNIVNGSSLLGLMTLAASKGTEIKIQCIGENSQEDLSKLVNLIKNNFGEEKPLSDNIIREVSFKGIPVSNGYAIGNCFVVEGNDITYSKYNIPIYEIKKEHKRLDLAVKKSLDDLSKIIEKIKGSRNDIYKEMKFMLQANKSIITSSSLIKDSKKRIQTDLINAEFAIIEELNKHSKIFKKIKDDYLKDRFDDVRDVCKRILENLQNKKKKKRKPQENQIIVASELSPADLLSHSKSKISGLVSILGGPEGHFAIVARSLSIPTVVGVKNFLKNIKNNEKIVLDGEKGLLIKNPTNQTVNFYKKKIEEQKNKDKKLNYLKKIIPKTQDNVRIKIEANIDNSDEAKESMKRGIDGIGLYRSEYLFMNKKRMPSENAQYDSLKKTLKYLKGKPLTIRTLDIGNDKKVPSIEKYLNKSPNPALGLRAIRLTLAFPKIFRRQISAILRASRHGNVRIMLPMVSNVSELTEAKKLIDNVRKDLLLKKVKISSTPPDVGVLIETPAAALISEAIAKNCDFLAIGTNDLTMYTLAIDRGDEEVAKIYDPAHLSVLRLIKLSAESAKKVGVPVSVCGEMAGDTNFTSLLLGMGINGLSMSISRILKVKQFIENINYEEVKKISDEILEEDDSVRIKQILKSYYNKINRMINN